ncbi:hypothetical protein BP5796_12201 [Coleophoma crateriformis]|uniref:Uncharacterized protein n=1 Tax=Coleophoma crateriformis TaxID=565419 RepID=A0A3D8Q8Y7_9HELO|nr:hypothetical protein BP5796_12201 [Coleophoma crateriformis]
MSSILASSNQELTIEQSSRGVRGRKPLFPPFPIHHRHGHGRCLGLGPVELPGAAEQPPRIICVAFHCCYWCFAIGALLKSLETAYAAVEDEIVEAFQSLDIQIIGLKDGLSTACHEETTENHDITIASLPTSFSNVRDAQIYLTHIVRRSYHFIGTVLTYLPSTSATVQQRDGELAGDFFMSRTMNSSRPFPNTDTMRTQQAQLATETAAWMHAFAPDVPTPCAYNAAVMMQMQTITTTILIAGVAMTNEMEYDKFRPQFDELVALATAVIGLRQQRKKDRVWAGGFWVDIGITPQLLVVVTRCRDTAIRRQAIALLEGWYIEGGWDPRLVAELGLFMIEVEEQEIERVMKFNAEQDENRIMG